MRIGPSVRKALGPYERAVAEWYRRVFVDIDRFVGDLCDVATPRRILEVGCGEGAVTERLLQALPEARCLAIDVSPTVGRLFCGDRRRVEFRQVPVEEVARERPAAFDLVLICDVLHHVPWEQHADFLRAAWQTVAPRGWLVLKDWVRTPTPIHLICYLSDRFVTGDRVRYRSGEQLRALACAVTGATAPWAEQVVPPWRNNLSLLFRR